MNRSLFRSAFGLLLFGLLFIGAAGRVALAAPVPTTLSITDSGVIEPSSGGTVNLNFTVTRSGNLTSQITVGYTTVAGTAQANTNFTPTTGTTTFASGAATATIGIPVFGDGMYHQPSLSFTVQLTGIVQVIGPPVTLAAGGDFAAGASPSFVAIGDVNGDGRPDLAVVNLDSNSVSVFLNTTTPGANAPSFTAQQSFAVGASSNAVAFGDFNGDGRADLAVTSFSANTVSVLLNTTAPGATVPSFTNQHTFAVGVSSTFLAIGDLNGDGKPDLAVSNGGSHTVSVLLNTTTPGAATPSFGAQQNFATGEFPTGVAIGDLNGDDRPDLTVTNAASRTVSVFLNTTAPGAPTPSFAAQQSFATESIPRRVVLADLNGDGRSDLVIPNGGSRTVSVLLNTTAPSAALPSFADQQTFATGSNPISVAVADLNGDGQPDLALTNNGAGTVSVLLNTTAVGGSTPTFASQTTFASGTSPTSVAIGDLNGDGQPDLAVANSQADTVSLFLNTTTLGEPAPVFATSAGQPAGMHPYSVATGDLNGDGRPDLVVANYDQSAATVSVLLNTTPPGATTPSFAAPQSFAAGFSPNFVAIGDLNGDGRPDLAVSSFSGSRVTVLLNTTTPGTTIPSFAPEGDFPTEGSETRSLVLGDLNGDGKPDLIVPNASSKVSVLLNNTSPGATVPSFLPQQSFAVGSAPYSVALGDFNADGRPDLAVTNSLADTVSVLLNTGAPGATTASFSPPQSFATGSRPTGVAINDINGDGRPDLAVTHFSSDTVSVLLNTTAPGATAPSFAAQQTFATGTSSFSIALADVNGDGRPDLAVTNSDSVSVLLNTTTPGGSASFATQQIFTAGYFTAAVAVDDLNGDGRPDLAVANYSSNSVSVLLNTPVSITVGTATGTITEIEPAAIVATSGTPQSAAANGAFANPLVITVRDAADLPLSGVAVTFTAPADGASIVFSNASNTITGTTDGSGQLSLNVRANATIGGSYLVSAAVVGVATQVSFALTNLSPAAGDFAFTSGTRAIEIDVLANDLSANASFTILTPPAHGMATIVGGKIRYVPTRALPLGGDSFTYQYDDGLGGIGTATVTIGNFATIAGTYDGLIVGNAAGTGAERHEQSGYLRVTLGKTGAFSGALTFAGTKLNPITRLTFRGFGFNSQLGSAGQGARLLLRAPQAPIHLALQLDAGTRTIAGTASSTDTDGQTFASPFHLAAQTATPMLAGRYTLLLDPDPTPASPQGTGFAAVTLTPAGAVKVAGILADGTAFSSATSLHGDASFVIHTGLYPGAFALHGSLRGTVAFAAPPASGLAAGTVDWFKPARLTDPRFPGGFSVTRQVRLSPYQRPPTGTRMLAFDPIPGNGRAILTAGGITTIDQPFTLTSKNTATISSPNPVKLSLRFDVGAGLFHGGFLNPVSGIPTSFHGAISSFDASGSGFFLGAGPDEGGSAEIGKP